MRLPGRDDAITLVSAFMDRRDGAHGDRPTPVVVFVGPRGCGKTALLGVLESDKLSRRTPYAHLNFADVGDLDILGVLDFLVFDLNRHCAGFGRIEFPRYLVGRMVLRENVGDVSPDERRRKIEELLAQLRPRRLRANVSELVTSVTAMLAGAMGIPDGVSSMVAKLLVEGVTELGGLRVRVKDGVRWYGHQDRRLDREALDVLAELNFEGHVHGDGAGKAADELMLAAFLADLRHAFRGKKQPLDCGVLFDNIDEPAARGFLDALVEARRQRRGDAPGDPDPMTVVATSRGTLAELAGEIPTPDVAGPAHYQRWQHHGHWPGRYPGRYKVRLPDLTLADIRTMVDTAAIDMRVARQAALAVHGFTRGHPGATRTLVDAIADGWVDVFDLRVMPSESEREPVTDQLWRDLLADLPPLATESDLVTCTAARDLDQTARLANSSGLLRRATADVISQTQLWLPDPLGGAPVMIPVLRTLLLEQLARRPGGVPNHWDEVHTWLRGDAAARNDVIGELYHALALGEIEHVSARIAERLATDRIDEWIALVRAVTGAPVRWAESRSPLERFDRLVGPVSGRTDLPGVVNRLVAALWIVSDSMAVHNRASLHRQIADEYRKIKGPGSTALARLDQEIERHEELAAQWK